MGHKCLLDGRRFAGGSQGGLHVQFLILVFGRQGARHCQLTLQFPLGCSLGLK